MRLLLGFPALLSDHGDPQQWARRPATLPAGWEAITVERLWIRGRATRLEARQGARAVLGVGGDRDGTARTAMLTRTRRNRHPIAAGLSVFGPPGHPAGRLRP